MIRNKWLTISEKIHFTGGHRHMYSYVYHIGYYGYSIHLCLGGLDSGWEYSCTTHVEKGKIGVPCISACGMGWKTDKGEKS